MANALLIKSYTSKNGSQGKWNNLDDAISYIQGIETGKVLDDLTADKLAALISGLPSPWARARLFKFAFDTIAKPDPNIKESGLDQFYEKLIGEWKGLVAILALYGDRVRFSQPVMMNPQGDDYSITAAFGRMLFSDADIWTNQDELAKDPDASPFIQLIYYNDHLIGGTSPLTGFFTGINYANLNKEMSDINWYRGGAFEDPTPFFDNQQRQKVYLFVRNMNTNMSVFEAKINSQRNGKSPIDLSGFKTICREWEDALFKQGNGKLKDKGPIAQYSNLSCPFSTLVESNVPVYLKKDFTFTYTDDGECQTVGDIQGLLSSDRFVIGWSESKEASPKLRDGSMYYLSVKDIKDGSCCYFTIPLSERGLDIFQNNLGGLLGYTQSGTAQLTAEITESGMLAVSLMVEIDGSPVALNTREYTISWQDFPAKVIMWPNFVSEKWNRYYLYSEFTSDAQQQFVPIFRWGGEIIKTANGQFLTSRYEPQPTEDKKIEVKNLVTYKSGLGEELPKYNIIGVNKPIYGLSAFAKDAGKEGHAGFLVFRSDVVRDLTSVDLRSEAVVGFDFGSNNTCVYYNADDHGAQPIQFENCRTVLVGQENLDKRSLATNDELLFFSNYPSENGQVKSWLHEHDSRFNRYNESEEISGGVPVYRPNVQVREMTPYEITTQAGSMHYNMKWLDDEKGLNKKRAFIKTIWLQACAFLYTNRIRPTQINWSYPGSMMESDRNTLEQTFEMLCNLSPIDGRRPQIQNGLTTEAEAVCSFALSQPFGLGTDNMFLGIDVGGSTSDILLLAKGNGNQETLYRESSARIAAGVFFNAVIKSEAFRNALVNFHEGKKVRNLHVENIREILTNPEKAPYYLNNIFDQLKTNDDYDTFYSSLSENAKFVFTIPAYVTGVLLFYSGMLIGKAIKGNHLDNIKKVDVLSFGKGGRLFHWLKSATTSRVTNEYYADCVNAGVQCVADLKLDIRYRDENSEFNKAEVAIGLCDMKPVNMAQQSADSDICGERNVSFTLSDGSVRNLNVEDEISGDFFDNRMNNFNFGQAVNLEKFMAIFIDFVSHKTNLYRDAENMLYSDIADVPGRIANNIVNNDEEYKKAIRNNANGFHYHQPIIMAEALCMLDTLIKKVFDR